MGEGANDVGRLEKRFDAGSRVELASFRCIKPRQVPRKTYNKEIEIACSALKVPSRTVST
jgi:hypothetical protein